MSTHEKATDHASDCDSSDTESLADTDDYMFDMLANHDKMVSNYEEKYCKYQLIVDFVCGVWAGSGPHGRTANRRKQL